MPAIETDYLIIGTGCVGMAFADTLVDECDADIVMVDGHGQPGGHWNDAYPFVTLHQPSSFYGVASKALGRDRVDSTGLNAGMGELATGAEVVHYYDEVMRDHLLATGRVRYFPKSWWDFNNSFTSQVTGERTEVTVRKRFVDTTHLKTTVPSTHTPAYSMDPAARCMPLNDLPKINQPPAGWVVVGGGKTGMDACLWLLAQGVDPDAITWIMPRDGWLIPRETTQPRMESFEQTFAAQAAQFEACAAAESVDDLFDRLEAAGVLVRLDARIKPTMFHAPTVSRQELAELRRIHNVIRMGRVTHIGTDSITLTGGTIATSPDHVHVDCSASAIPVQPPKTLFDGRVITPQTVRAFQPAFSASVIAWVEAHLEDDAEKNAICGVVPIPNSRDDWLHLTIANAMNMARWQDEKELLGFLAGNRLNAFARLAGQIDRDDTEKMSLLGRMRAAMTPGVTNLMKLVGELDAKTAAAG